MFKVNNKTPERLSTVFFVNFWCFLHLFLLFLLLTLNKTRLNVQIANYCNKLRITIFGETEAHERLSSTRATIETSLGHIVKNVSVLFSKILLLRT